MNHDRIRILALRAKSVQELRRSGIAENMSIITPTRFDDLVANLSEKPGRLRDILKRAEQRGLVIKSYGPHGGAGRGPVCFRFTLEYSRAFAWARNTLLPKLENRSAYLIVRHLCDAGEPRTIPELANVAGIGIRAVPFILKALEGHVIRVSRGLYGIASPEVAATLLEIERASI